MIYPRYISKIHTRKMLNSAKFLPQYIKLGLLFDSQFAPRARGETPIRYRETGLDSQSQHHKNFAHSSKQFPSFQAFHASSTDTTISASGSNTPMLVRTVFRSKIYSEESLQFPPRRFRIVELKITIAFFLDCKKFYFVVIVQQKLPCRYFANTNTRIVFGNSKNYWKHKQSQPSAWSKDGAATHLPRRLCSTKVWLPQF